MKGFFISFEGADGSGKSTQLQQTAVTLQAMGYNVLVTREPGGTQMAEKVRSLILDSDLPLSVTAEVLLYLAARSEHVEKVIKPALSENKVVLCDRFSDSTMVYQGLINGITYNELKMLRQLNDFACQGILPQLTILLDADINELAKRRAIRGASDRYEKQGLNFQQQVRAGFLELAKREPQRIVTIDALQTKECVQRDIIQKISGILRMK